MRNPLDRGKGLGLGICLEMTGIRVPRDGVDGDAGVLDDITTVHSRRVTCLPV